MPPTPFPRGRALTAVALALLSGAAFAGEECRLADLQWMSGAWLGGGGADRSEERWTSGPGDRLMGSAWLLHADRPGGVVEASTVQTDGAGRVVLRLRHFSATLEQAREDKDAPMTFVAAQCGDRSVVFDGQGPQAGEHMTYRRDGSRLQFTGEFLHDGKPLRVELAFTLAGS